MHKIYCYEGCENVNRLIQFSQLIPVFSNGPYVRITNQVISSWNHIITL
jgi:hypothetical protein